MKRYSFILAPRYLFNDKHVISVVSPDDSEEKGLKFLAEISKGCCSPGFCDPSGIELSDVATKEEFHYEDAPADQLYLHTGRLGSCQRT